MKHPIKIPPMGESVTQATIGSFLKSSGEFVQESEEIVELETEKVNQALYAPVSGRLEWTVKEKEDVSIGQEIGFIDDQAQREKKEEAPSKEKEKPKKEEKPSPPPPVKEEKPPTAIKKEKRVPLSRIRKTIGSRLVQALHQSAMLTTFNEADMSEILALRTKHQESFTKKHGVKLGFMSFFVKACVYALKEIPNLHAFIDQDDLVYPETYDISIAISTEKGLFTPVVRECETLSFAEIEKTIDGLAQKARSGKMAISDLEGGGFTISNGGVFGSLLSTPILNPPQSGILGMHKIQKRAVVIDDQIVIRPMMYLALSYDHRVVDGKEAVTFLVKVKEFLENPALQLFDNE